ncbi:hypothetical protein BT93_F1062 [Corymbia citriodora subsp. variegata]|nr:hypothetical protein BT93_F1062 [Corymbia citriodora subsp. variegata]
MKRVGLSEPVLGLQFQSPRREHPCCQFLRGISCLRRQYTPPVDLRRIGSPSPDHNSSLRYHHRPLLLHFRLHIRPSHVDEVLQEEPQTLNFGCSLRTGMSLLGFEFRGFNEWCSVL